MDAAPATLAADVVAPASSGGANGAAPLTAAPAALPPLPSTQLGIAAGGGEFSSTAAAPAPTAEENPTAAAAAALVTTAQNALTEAKAEAPAPAKVTKAQRYRVRVGLCTALHTRHNHFYKQGRRPNDFVIHAPDSQGNRGAMVARAWPALRTYAVAPENAELLASLLQQSAGEAWVSDFKFVVDSYRYFNNERNLMLARQQARRVERNDRSAREGDDPARTAWRQFRPPARKRKAVTRFVDESADAMEEEVRKRKIIMDERKRLQRERELREKEEAKAAAKAARRKAKEEVQQRQFYEREDRRIVKLERRVLARYGARRAAFGGGPNDPRRFAPPTPDGGWLLAAACRAALSSISATSSASATADTSATLRWSEAQPPALRRVRAMPELIAVATFAWCVAPALQIPPQLIALAPLERALAKLPAVGASASVDGGGGGGDVLGGGVVGGNVLDLLMTRLVCPATSIGRFGSVETENVALPYEWWNARLVALVDDWYERRRIADETLAAFWGLRRGWRDGVRGDGAAFVAAAGAEAIAPAPAAGAPALAAPAPPTAGAPGLSDDATATAAVLERLVALVAAPSASSLRDDATAAAVAAVTKEPLLVPADIADASAVAHEHWEVSGASIEGHVVRVKHGSRQFDCVVTKVVIPRRRYAVWYLKDNTTEKSVACNRISAIANSRSSVLHVGAMEAFVRQAAARLNAAAGKATASLARRSSGSSTTSLPDGLLGTQRAPSGRRQRCRQCDGCLRPDCGRCRMCLDRPKFGGPGNLRQACMHRICTSNGLMADDNSALAALAAHRRKAELAGDVRAAPNLEKYRDALGGLTLEELKAEAEWWAWLLSTVDGSGADSAEGAGADSAGTTATIPVSPFIASAELGGVSLGFNDLDVPTRVRLLSALCHARLDRCVFTQRHARRIEEKDQRCGQILGFDVSGRMLYHFPRFRDGHARVYASTETRAKPHHLRSVDAAGAPSWTLLCDDVAGLRRVRDEWCTVGKACRSPKRQRIEEADIAELVRNWSSSPEASLLKLRDRINKIVDEAEESEQRWKRLHPKRVVPVVVHDDFATVVRRSTRVEALNIGRAEAQTIVKQTKQSELLELLDDDARKGRLKAEEDVVDFDMGEDETDSSDDGATRETRISLRSSRSGRDRQRYGEDGTSLEPRRRKGGGRKAKKWGGHPPANTTCNECGSGERRETIILCDRRRCKAGYHLECLDPPLTRKPKRRWLCPECIDLGYDPAESDSDGAMSDDEGGAPAFQQQQQQEVAAPQKPPLTRLPKKVRVVWSVRKGVLNSFGWMECRVDG